MTVPRVRSVLTKAIKSWRLPFEKTELIATPPPVAPADAPQADVLAVVKETLKTFFPPALGVIEPETVHPFVVLEIAPLPEIFTLNALFERSLLGQVPVMSAKLAAVLNVAVFAALELEEKVATCPLTVVVPVMLVPTT